MASFLKKYIPGFERSFVIDISPVAASRNSRAIDGEFSFTEENTYQPKDDAIFVFGTGSYLKAYGRTFQAPYRMMLPKQVENLLVAGGCASSAVTGSQHGRLYGHGACSGDRGSSLRGERRQGRGTWISGNYKRNCGRRGRSWRSPACIRSHRAGSHAIR